MLRVSWSSWGRVHLLLLAPLVLLPASSAKTWSQTRARLKVSHTDLTKGWALSWGGGVSSGYDALLLDEDRGWLLVGGRDHIYLLRPDSLELLAPTIYWPAVREDVERCRLAGKSPQADCANFVRLLQPFNETHVYACGTGAFHPQCTHVHVGLSTQEPSFTLSPVVESGRGKCPFSPSEPFAAHLTGGELYSGTSVDFMGANAGIFRTVARAGGRPYIRTEAYDQNWLNEPDFVSAFSIPDTHSADDDKVYFFFKERAVEADQWDKRVYSRVARVCKNDVGGKRSLINRWTTFLKARLLCPVPGPSGVDTHFDELEDIFVLETKDPQNPTIYGVFSTSSSIFRGSAVCVYSMASIRAAFNGPFAHREGPDYRWVEYRGRIPYPRPGTCPSETYDVLHRSTTDFPDDLVSFMRQHQLMWEPVLPLGGRPLLTSVHGGDTFRRVVVDRVDAHDGLYDVLHLGTGEGKVLKAVSIIGRSGQMEQLLLEELTVFQSPSPILRMELSNKRQQLYVSGPLGVVQLGLQRCQLYGNSCAECCLARDPYCSWDGQTCSRSFPTNQRRARRQDVRDGDPCRHCLATEDESLEVKVLYGVEGNSTFLECTAHLQAELRWTFQNTEEQQRGGGGTRDGRELPLQGDEEHVLLMGRGLLLQHLQLSHSGVYTCTSHQRSFSQGLARYRVHVLASAALRPGQRLQQNHASPGSVLPGDRKWWPRPQQLPASSRDQACEQLWQRQKRRQQKLRTLKQEEKKARVRRNNPAELGEDGGP